MDLEFCFSLSKLKGNFLRKSNAFTLLEIIVVIIIVGVLAVITIPGLINGAFQSKVQTVEHNLMAISAAQQRYFEQQNQYYSSNGNPDDFNGINSNLIVGMAYQGDDFTYSCDNTGTCTATSASPVETVSMNALGSMTCSGKFNSCP